MSQAKADPVAEKIVVEVVDAIWGTIEEPIDVVEHASGVCGINHELPLACLDDHGSTKPLEKVPSLPLLRSKAMKRQGFTAAAAVPSPSNRAVAPKMRFAMHQIQVAPVMLLAIFWQIELPNEVAFLSLRTLEGFLPLQQRTASQHILGTEQQA